MDATKIGEASSTSSSTTQTVTTSAAVASGDHVFAVFAWRNAPVLAATPITDDSGLGLSWQVDVNERNSGNSANIIIASAYCPSGLPSGTVITFTLATAATHKGARIYTRGGLETSSYVDDVGSDSFGATATTFNNNVDQVVTTVADTWLLGGVFISAGEASITVDSPWVTDASGIWDVGGAGVRTMQTGDQTVSATGTYGYTGSYPTAAVNVAAAVAYKIASGASPQTISPASVADASSASGLAVAGSGAASAAPASVADTSSARGLAVAGSGDAPVSPASVPDASVVSGLTVTAAPTGYAAEVLADAPVAYYRMEDAGSTITDETGNGHDGTVNGTLSQQQPGGVGDGIIFPGVTADYVSIPDAAELSPQAGTSGVLSVELIASAASIGGARNWILTKGGTVGTYEYAIFVSTAGKLSGYVYTPAGGGVGLTIDPTAFVTDKLYHVVLTFDHAAQEAKLYVDGSLVSTNASGSTWTNSSTAGSDPVILGRRGDAADYEWNGLIDEVAIYDTVLSPTRIAAHYAATGLAPPPDQTIAPASVPDSSSVRGLSVTVDTGLQPELIEQVASNTSNDSTLLGVDFAALTASGSVIAVQIAVKQSVPNDQFITSVTDDAGNRYRPYNGTKPQNAGFRHEWWVAQNTQSAQHITIEAAAPSAVLPLRLLAEAYEVSGAATVAPVSASVSDYAGSTSTGPRIPDITIPSAALLLGGAAYATSADTTWDTLDGWTKISRLTTLGSGAASLATGKLEAASAGTYASDGIYSSGTHAWTGGAIAIIPPNPSLVAVAPAAVPDPSSVSGISILGTGGIIQLATVPDTSSVPGLTVLGSGAGPAVAPASVPDSSDVYGLTPHPDGVGIVAAGVVDDTSSVSGISVVITGAACVNPASVPDPSSVHGLTVHGTAASQLDAASVPDQSSVGGISIRTSMRLSIASVPDSSEVGGISLSLHPGPTDNYLVHIYG